MKHRFYVILPVVLNSWSSFSNKIFKEKLLCGDDEDLRSRSSRNMSFQQGDAFDEET